MKKPHFNTLILVFIFFISKLSYSQKAIIDINKITSTDELFKIKNSVSIDDNINFIKQFYTVSIVEEALYHNTFNRDAFLLGLSDLITIDNFSCLSLNIHKVQSLINKCKTKTELQEIIKKNVNITGKGDFFDESSVNGGLKKFNIQKLTNDIYTLSSPECNNHGYFSNYYILIEDKIKSRYQVGNTYLESKIYNAFKKLENNLNRKFSLESNNSDPYGVTIINEEQYILVPYKEVIIEENYPLVLLNLLFAYNLNNDKIYYLYLDSAKKSINSEYNQFDYQDNNYKLEVANWKIIQ